MIIALLAGCFHGNINYTNKVEVIKNIEGKEVAVSGVIISRENNNCLLKNVYINNNKIKGKVKIRTKSEYEVLDELSSITPGRIYFIEQDEKYIEVKLFEPNKYYIKNYVNCESLKFDSVNNVYYIYTEDG
jgi:hypothetical protein